MFRLAVSVHVTTRCRLHASVSHVKPSVPPSVLICGSAAARLTHVRNPFGRCGTYLKLVQIQGRDAASMTSTGLVPVLR